MACKRVHDVIDGLQEDFSLCNLNLTIAVRDRARMLEESLNRAEAGLQGIARDRDALAGDRAALDAAEHLSLLDDMLAAAFALTREFRRAIAVSSTCSFGFLHGHPSRVERRQA